MLGCLPFARKEKCEDDDVIPISKKAILNSAQTLREKNPVGKASPSPQFSAHLFSFLLVSTTDETSPSLILDGRSVSFYFHRSSAVVIYNSTCLCKAKAYVMFRRKALLAFCSFSSRRKFCPFVPPTPLFMSEKTFTSSTAPAIIPSMFPSQKEAQQHVGDSAKANAENLAKCGSLACQHDSFLQTLSSAKIVSYASFEYEEKAAGKKKQKKKGKKSNQAPADEAAADENTAKKYDPIVYAITLSDSVFFPEGGGQFADHGTLTLKATDGEDAEQKIELFVQDAQNVNEVCVLFCRLPADSESSPEDVTNMLDNPDDVQVEQMLDWDRRFDQMTQHSGQHLCSAIALSDFEIGTHTFSLGEKISYIDFTIEESWEKDYAIDIFAQIEQKVNSHIRDNLPIKPQWLEKDDPLFESEVRSRLLPEGLEGPIRLVQIGNGVDLNTCCGTHCPTLGQLQMIKFFRMEKVKPTILRVYFAAAKRLNVIMDNMYDTQAKLTSMLACTESEQVQRVTQLLDDKRDREKDIRTLNEKLSSCQSKEIIEECRSSEVDLAVADLGDVDMGYMTLVSTKAMDGIDTDQAIFLFVGGEDGCDEGSFLLVGDKTIVDKFGKKVAEMFDGRGGGRNGRFQGKGSRVRSSLEEVKNFLTFIIPKPQSPTKSS